MAVCLPRLPGSPFPSLTWTHSLLHCVFHVLSILIPFPAVPPWYGTASVESSLVRHWSSSLGWSSAAPLLTFPPPPRPNTGRRFLVLPAALGLEPLLSYRYLLTIWEVSCSHGFPLFSFLSHMNVDNMPVS